MKSVFCSEILDALKDLSWSEASEGAEEYRLPSIYLFLYVALFANTFNGTTVRI